MDTMSVCRCLIEGTTPDALLEADAATAAEERGERRKKAFSLFSPHVLIAAGSVHQFQKSPAVDKPLFEYYTDLLFLCQLWLQLRCRGQAKALEPRWS